MGLEEETRKAWERPRRCPSSYRRWQAGKVDAKVKATAKQLSLRMIYVENVECVFGVI